MVRVKYKGGPRDGKKGNLTHKTNAPKTLAAKDEAKAANMAPGVYRLTGSGMGSDNIVTYTYTWMQTSI